MNVIKPWIGYISVVDVDHEDAIRIQQTGVGSDNILGQVLGIPEKYEVPQGIVAGVVMETGDQVPALVTGSKVYYSGAAAIVVGDVKIVHSNYVIAYEEAL